MKLQQTANTDTSLNLDEIGTALDLAPMPDNQTLIPAESKNIDDDYEYARGNIIAAIERGREALDGIVDVAGMSQHPRSYEVAATLVKTMVEANKDLLALIKQKKDIDKIDGKGNQTINNNLFVGSTAELLKMIKRGEDIT